MRDGRFSAIGYEARLAGSLYFIIPIIGVAQFALLVTLSSGPATELDFISAGIAVLSLISVIILRLMEAPTGSVTVMFRDKRPEGGPLELTFIDQRGKSHGPRAVRDIEVDEGGALWRNQGRVRTRVPGTSSSMTIYFANSKQVLALGFPDTAEMNKAYGELENVQNMKSKE